MLGQPEPSAGMLQRSKNSDSAKHAVQTDPVIWMYPAGLFSCQKSISPGHRGTARASGQERKNFALFILGKFFEPQSLALLVCMASNAGSSNHHNGLV